MFYVIMQQKHLSTEVMTRHNITTTDRSEVENTDYFFITSPVSMLDIQQANILSLKLMSEAGKNEQI